MSFVAVQCPYAGNPVATEIMSDDILQEIAGRALASLLPREGATQEKRMEELLAPIACLTYPERKRVLAERPFPVADVPCVCFHTKASRTSSLLSAAAIYIAQRYGGAESDGAVTRVDAEIPGSTAIRPAEECDHMQAVFATQWPPVTDSQPMSGHDNAGRQESFGPLVVRANQAIEQVFGVSAVGRGVGHKRIRASQGEVHEALIAQACKASSSASLN